MRDYQRKEFERPRLNLVRGADGRLKPAGDEDITDIWAEQKRIRQTVTLAEKEYRQPQEQAHHKTPVVDLPKTIKRKHQTFNIREILRNKYALVGAVVVAIIALNVVGFNLIKTDDKVARQLPQPNTDVLNAADKNSPAFDAVLPSGKIIEDLGGWVRVSPADKDPVFAYVDTTDGVQLNVSQQELPEALRANTSQEVEKLAQGFAANEKLVAGDIVAYLGTSIRGPQSVIFVKNGLLILVKSSGALTNEQWVGYISSLR